jgi:O-antigen/teichoic acid export membrane protein
MTEELSQVTEESARGGFFLFSGTALSSIILAVSVVLLGRFLGPDLYGQYNLIIVIPSLLLLFTDLGVKSGITKFVAALRKDGKDTHAATIISHGLLFRIVIGVAVSILSIIFADYCALLINRPDLSFYIQIASVSIIFQIVVNTVNAGFVGLGQSEYYALTSNVQAIFRTVCQIALVVLGFGITGALIGYISGFVVASALAVVLLFFKYLKPNHFLKSEKSPRDYLTSFKLLTHYGMPVYVSVVLIGFFPLYQQLILAFFASDAAIGNFRAAYNFAMLLTVLLTTISMGLLPAFSKLETSPSLVSIFFKRANKYTTLIMVPLTTLVILFSKPIVQVLYGSVYDSAPLFLSLSCLLYFLVGIGYLTLTNVFNGLNKTRLSMKVTLVNFIILIALSPVFAMVWNVVGVIIAYLIAGTVASLYAAFVAVKEIKIRFELKPLFRIYFISAISSLPSIFILVFTSLSSLALLGLGAITYLISFITLMPLMRVVNKSELQELTRITESIPVLKIIAKPLFRYQTKLLSIIWPSKQL